MEITGVVSFNFYFQFHNFGSIRQHAKYFLTGTTHKVMPYSD